MTHSLSIAAAPSLTRSRWRGLLQKLRLPGLLLGSCLIVAPTLLAASAEVSKEYRIKAAFLYNFTKFVDWPPTNFDNVDSPIVIGVLGGNPFGGALADTVRDRKVNGRPVEIVQLDGRESVERVHVIFVCAGADPRTYASLMEKYRAVLTVGEGDAAAKLDPVINFETVGDKVRFEVNVTTAEERGLRVSAQLQKLATNVRR